QTKSGAQAGALFAKAGEKYEAALKIKLDKHEALYNWGNALSEQAKTKSGAQADALFAKAGEKYEAALKIKPDYHKALNNWGNALFEQAQTKSGVQAEALFAEAEEKLRIGEAIKPGSCAYNLACVAALRGQSSEAKKWLNEALTHESLPAREHLMADQDLDSIRGESWFQEVLSRAPKD